MPEGNLKEPPEWLTPSQREIWIRCLADAPEGLLKRIDGALLETYVTSLDMYRTACQMQARLDATGLPLLVQSPKVGALVQSPYLPIINRQAVILKHLAAEMGFSPTARSRISLNARSEDDADERDLFGF